MSQNIVHKSRYTQFTLNFAATENTLTWPFTSGCDGEIYEVELNNVSSYSINGVSQNISRTNPFTVQNETSYTVSITKTTNGQTASIVFRIRRAVDKFNTISVPDFNLYNGRYLYLLNSINQVEKRDMSLRTPSYYSGSGVWSQTSLVSTITLPTPPANHYWVHIEFCPVNNIEQYLVFGVVYTGATGSFGNIIVCKIVNDVVYSLSGIVDSYTTLTAVAFPTTVLDYSQLLSTQFDYISNICYFEWYNNGGGFINLNTNTYTEYNWYTNMPIQYSNLLGVGIYSNKLIRNATFFDPYNKLFIRQFFIDMINLKNGNYIYAYVNVCIDFETGYIIGSEDGQSAVSIRRSTREGQFLSKYNLGSTNSYNSATINYSNKLKQAVLRSSNTRYYSIYSKTANNGANYILSNNLYTTQLHNLDWSANAGIWIVSQYNLNYTTRLHYLKYGETVPDFGYEDFPNGIRGFVTNDLKF